MKPCLIYLTCADINEASKISSALLEKKLIACAKKIPISSSFLWQNKIDHAEEILLIMESIEENFEKVEEVVSRLHSYDNFVLTATPLTKINKITIFPAISPCQDIPVNLQ